MPGKMALTPNEVVTSPDGPQDSTKKDGSVPWPTDDSEIAAHVSELQKKADGAAGDWYDGARQDFQLYESKQWSDEDTDSMQREDRIPVTFNRIAATVNALVGQEVSNRQEVRYLARRVGPIPQAADPMNDAVKWAREQCNAEDEDSDAFRDMWICGMGWTVMRMDYEANPDGQPEVLRRDPLLMRWDPGARRKNLADKEWVQSDYWMQREQIVARWPDADLAMVANMTRSSDRMTPVDASQNWKYNRSSTGQAKRGDEWRVVHHVQKYVQTRHRMVDPATQTMREYSDTEFEDLKTKAEQAGVELPQDLPVQKRVFWEAWTVGGVVLQSGPSKVQEGFQYECMTCYRVREDGYWTGIVKLMREPQKYANRLMSLMMSILATGAKGGMLYETGTFANSKKAKDDWGRWNAAIEVNPGKLERILPRQPVQMPPAAGDLLQFTISSIRDVTGANIEVLGQVNDNETGVVEDMKVKAGLVILASGFDAMRLYRKRTAPIWAEFIRNFISDGRLIRILGQGGQQFLPLIRDVFAMDYDIVVDESPSSRDVKARTFQTMQLVAPMAMQAGLPLPPSLIDYLPLPQSLIMDWKQAIQQKQQQPPQPPIPVQIEQMKLAAAREDAQAKAQADAQSDQARMQADVAIAQQKAQIESQVDLAKNERQAQLDAVANQAKISTELRIAEIRAAAQVEAARIAANAQLLGSQMVNTLTKDAGLDGAADKEQQPGPLDQISQIAKSVGEIHQMHQSLHQRITGQRHSRLDSK